MCSRLDLTGLLCTIASFWLSSIWIHVPLVGNPPRWWCRWKAVPHLPLRKPERKDDVSSPSRCIRMQAYDLLGPATLTRDWDLEWVTETDKWWDFIFSYGSGALAMVAVWFQCPELGVVGIWQWYSPGKLVSTAQTPWMSASFHSYFASPPVHVGRYLISFQQKPFCVS